MAATGIRVRLCFMRKTVCPASRSTILDDIQTDARRPLQVYCEAWRGYLCSCSCKKLLNMIVHMVLKKEVLIQRQEGCNELFTVIRWSTCVPICCSCCCAASLVNLMSLVCKGLQGEGRCHSDRNVACYTDDVPLIESRC